MLLLQSFILIILGVTQLDFNYLNLLDVEKYHNKFIFITQLATYQKVQ